MPYTRPWSSSTGLGSVLKVTIVVTIAQATNARPEPAIDSLRSEPNPNTPAL